MERNEHTVKVPTTGVFDFPSLIFGGKGKYVDKTDLLYRLCNDAGQQLFISRPRRFGKSLMLSTLKAMFEGRRELFKGLAIDSLPWEGWTQPTPVYSFTMSSAVGETYELFMGRLAKLVKELCVQADAVLQDKSGTYVFEFKCGRTPAEALEQAKTKEYGNPWLDSSLPVFYVGVNYDPEKRGIDDPLVEALKN